MFFSLFQDPAGIFELVEVVGNGTYGQVYKVGWRRSAWPVLFSHSVFFFLYQAWEQRKWHLKKCLQKYLVLIRVWEVCVRSESDGLRSDGIINLTSPAFTEK